MVTRKWDTSFDRKVIVLFSSCEPSTTYFASSVSSLIDRQAVRRSVIMINNTQSIYFYRNRTQTLTNNMVVCVRKSIGSPVDDKNYRAV